jgi:hypothetical protein
LIAKGKTKERNSKENQYPHVEFCVISLDLSNNQLNTVMDVPWKKI